MHTPTGPLPPNKMYNDTMITNVKTKNKITRNKENATKKEIRTLFQAERNEK